MKEEIKKKKNPNIEKYKKDELDLALAFSKLAYTEFKDILKGIILFGSAARRLNEENSEEAKDIDLLIVLDDINVDITKDIAEAYKIISAKIVAKVSPKIHVTTLKFSTFWDYARNGDPVVVNVLRDGVAIIDTGFFDPLQALLMKGRIQPSYECVWTHFNRATTSINVSRTRMFDATIDLYWAVVDSAHAALMKNGTVPQSPDLLAELINEKLVKTKLATVREVDTMKLFYGLYKEITHKQIQEISGMDYEKYYSRAKEFVDKMKRAITILDQ